MKILFKLFLNMLVISIFLTGCGTIKEGFVGKKKNNSDEFLVEKKNPLVLPPDFDDLPTPKDMEEKVITNYKSDLEKILKKNSSLENIPSTTVESNSSLDKSILEKIKNN